MNYLGHHTKKPSAIIIEDFFSSWELDQIWHELEALDPYMQSADRTGSAHDIDTGKILKQSATLYMYQHYQGRKQESNIIALSKKIFDRNFVDSIIAIDPIFRSVAMCNKDSLLLSCYQDSNYYRAHADFCAVTALYYFHQEPKTFSGGDLILNDFDVTIPIKNNQLVLIPSVYLHEATAVSGSGRYCLAQFLELVTPTR
jgi:Rps23 Pro-64 3,4-dihydroxylase Tpa1-like proline 4-hydroxylase